MSLVKAVSAFMGLQSAKTGSTQVLRTLFPAPTARALSTDKKPDPLAAIRGKFDHNLIAKLVSVQEGTINIRYQHVHENESKEMASLLSEAHDSQANRTGYNASNNHYGFSIGRP